MRAPDGPGAAHELDPRRLPDLLRFPQQHDPDLARRADVRAAAGATVEAFDRDDPQRALAVRGLAEALRLGGVFEADGDGPVLVDDLVGAPLDGGEDVGVDGHAFDVDSRALGAEVEADGPKV